MLKLAGTRGAPKGVYCGWDGVYLGSAPLIELRDAQYWIRQEPEIAAILKAAYEPVPDLAGCLRDLNKIAASLDKGDLGGAMIEALQMRLGEISERALVCVTQIDRMLKYNFNPLQPRDRQGR